MEFKVTIADPLEHPCRALVVGCFEGEVRTPLLSRLDESLGGCLTGFYERREFTGKLNKTRLVHTLGRLPAEQILFVGLGKQDELTRDKVRQAAGTAMQSLRPSGVRSISTLLHMTDGGTNEMLQAAVEGALLGGYSFNRYKTKDEDPTSIEEVTLLFPDTAAASRGESVVNEAQTLCNAALLARDLVSQPANVATPAYLAENALEMCGKYGITCRIMERDDMERNAMEALLAVAKGSQQPPKFIILEYLPAGKEISPTVLVGKGVTFDSGGISLKPREGMEKMKSDMAGAAAVLGTLQAVAALKLPLNLVGLIPTAENLPGGNAYKPGDLIRSMSGQTIEVVNTDAEGRLLLCDALHYAQRYDPAAIIDVATLTGACVVALGDVVTGLMGNDESLKSAIKKAGDASGERVWELPLWEEYGEIMKSDIADMKNAGGPGAGTISAGGFLQQFVGKVPWVHLDIAGTAWEEKGRPYLPKGATGVGVRLLVEYLRELA
ncbi:MAG: leucyl [Geobacteraceae bacterium]|nr:MAG: leucyl [Geobacteraceae bacterium]